MDQQPGRRQQPGRTGHGRPQAGEQAPRNGRGRPGGGRAPRPPEDFVEDDPTMVRPFVKAPSGGSENDGTRRGRQGPDGRAPGGQPRQGTPGGGQGRQQQNGRAPEGGRGSEGGRGPQNGRGPENGRGPQNGRGPENGRGSQNGRGRSNGPGPDGSRSGGQGGGPGPRPPRDTDPRQVPGLVSTPMPPPRAVARHAPPQQLAPYPELDPPMSDLTTTMPILAVPADDGYDGYDDHDDHDGYHDYDNAAPGEHGHFHDDGDFGRHRGANRPPRALKIGAILAGVAVVGVAAYSVLGGGSNSPSSGPVAAGSTTANGAAGAAGSPSDSAAAAPNAPAPTGTSGSDSATESTPSTSHSTKTSPSKTSTSSHSSAPSSTAMTSRPSSAPPTTTTSAPAPPPPSSPSPTFTTLGPGSSGPAVSQLQQNLKSWGGYYGWRPLKVTGTWDTATTDAVQAFQDANTGTSPPDSYGVYGPATNQALLQAVG